MRVERNERGLLKWNAVLEKNPRGPGVSKEAKRIRKDELSPYGPPKPASIRRVPEDGVYTMSDKAMRLIASSHYAMREVLASGGHCHKAQRLAKNHEDQPETDRPSWRYKETPLHYELKCAGRHGEPIGARVIEEKRIVAQVAPFIQCCVNKLKRVENAENNSKERPSCSHRSIDPWRARYSSLRDDYCMDPKDTTEKECSKKDSAQAVLITERQSSSGEILRVRGVTISFGHSMLRNALIHSAHPLQHLHVAHIYLPYERKAFSKVTLSTAHQKKRP